MKRRRVLILGAAGRDFHDFNTVFRDDPDTEVVGFTATQIPRIEGRRYPAALAGRRYPDGIPIHPESELESIVRDEQVDDAVFAYSDVSWQTVGRVASRAMAAGAGVRILGPDETMLASPVPVVAITAVRTGCGKSPVTRAMARALRNAGHRVAVVRHPMPYGDLAKQAVQRFAALPDLDRHGCTFEEREEYERHVLEGTVVYAGVDYAAILARAAGEADVILWDGGNNDWPFYRPDVWVTVVDPLRPGHEFAYFPAEVNLRRADVVVINKARAATPEALATVERDIAQANPRATVLRTASVVTVDGDAASLRGKRVLCIEDGPTLTHGGMAYGAAVVAAERAGATIVDPRPHAVRSIRETLERYPHVGPLLPAMGYYPEQIADLEASVRATDCDVVLVGTPFDLARQLDVGRPVMRVDYEVEDLPDEGDGGTLAAAVLARLAPAFAEA